MNETLQGLSFSFCLCIILTACTPPDKKADVMDLYELPRAGRAVTVTPLAVDNDSYYVQPNNYQGCTVINDAPSCGGG
jgi:hypothetical protein